MLRDNRKKPATSKLPRKIAIGLGILAVIAAAAATPAGANSIPDQVNTFVQCFGWMLTDPVAHGGNCSPSRVLADPKNGSGSGFTNGPIVLPPPPPPSSSEPIVEVDLDGE